MGLTSQGGHLQYPERYVLDSRGIPICGKVPLISLYIMAMRSAGCSIETLHTAVEQAKVGRREQAEALKRLALWTETGAS
jgi:hypothetical protein